MRTMLAFVMVCAVAMSGAAFAQAPAGTLKIVVIEGEDAVNIIQQKTAVAPVIEVRDRNNLPVSGATVTFSLSGQGASFAGGAQSLTVVTNAAGQATAAGLTPTATGAVQISATASFQGQTAIATITQSNVLTAAEAASTTTGATSASGGTGGTTSTSTTAAGGGGGGLSGTTLGIIGAAVGGGAVVAKSASGGGDSPSTQVPTSANPPASSTTPPTTAPPTTTPTPQPASSSFSGPMDGTFNGASTVTVSGAPAFSCTFTMRQTGNAAIRLTTTSAGTISGTLDLSGKQVVSTTTCGEAFGVLGDEPFNYTANVEGSAGSVRFTQEFRDSFSVDGATVTSVATVTFTGTVSAGGVTGTLSYNSKAEVRGDGFTSLATWTGSIPINLR